MAAFHCRSAVALHDRLMSVSFTPQPQTLSAAIADRLRQEVLQGQWSPGETINDGMLATRYGIQRAPVREAMQQLSQEGLLCACTPHGMTLASPSPAQIAEAQELQALLQHYLNQHQAVDDGLAQRMLTMASQRMQLAALHA